jgi:outer membrane protein assembly factor BamB
MIPHGTLILCIFTASALADDWPQWRGPNRDAVWAEKQTLESFPAEGLKGTWRAPVGIGFSSPIVANGRVYVTDSELTKPTAHERVHCFDEQTGEVIWTRSHLVNYPDWAFTDPNNQLGPTSTPIVKDGKLYTWGAVGGLICFDAVKGDLLWQRDLQKEYPDKEISARTSPLIEGNLLILFVGAKPDACVIAYDKDTDRPVWKALSDSGTHSSPIVITAGGVRQLIVWTQESVTSLDPATGKTLWRQLLATQSDYVISTPVFHKDRLLFGGLMFKLNPDKPAATILWPQSRAVSGRVLSNTSTPYFDGSHVFSAKSNGALVCLDAATGQEIWQNNKVTDLKTGASIHITPNGESALLYTEKGELIRARLSADSYKELGRAKIIEPTYPFGDRKCAWAAPAFANRHVFARSDKELVCVSLDARP